MTRNAPPIGRNGDAWECVNPRRMFRHLTFPLIMASSFVEPQVQVNSKEARGASAYAHARARAGSLRSVEFVRGTRGFNSLFILWWKIISGCQEFFLRLKVSTKYSLGILITFRYSLNPEVEEISVECIWNWIFSPPSPYVEFHVDDLVVYCVLSEICLTRTFYIDLIEEKDTWIRRGNV